ncbi:hypothetical protein CGCF415_v005723 [Colletotrichum fructicola]|nr:hypothetical protein CGCFRS4_v005362 [Colletotrichum fructicola]KAF4909608.1 hypothetical protein CGCF415_v005723 [Colletotrichum fructicola]
MSNTQVHQGRFRRLVNRQKPIQLFNFIKVKVLRLRHRHGKPFGTSPTSAQDSAGHSPVFVDQNIPRTRNTKHDLTSLDDSEANNEQQGHGRLSKPTASQPYSSKNIHELIEFAGLKAASIQGCIGTASPKDAPFLEFQLVFGAGSPSSNIHCYRARAPRQVGHTNAWEYANDSDLWSPEEQPLKRSDRNTLRPTDRALACPYLMQDPTTYESRQGCRGAAFHDVSRLNKLALTVTITLENIFTDATDRSRIAQSVFLQEFKGFNKEQEAKLKDKKRKRGGSKVAKWKDIFDILFPDAIEVPCPYYKPPAFQQFQDSAVERRDMMHDLINNLFKNHVSGSIARSQVEKMKGPMTEEDWSKMKEIFRSFVLSDVKASRTTAAGDMNQDFSKSTEAIESQISVCE